MVDIFISYSREDKAVVKNLVLQLEEKGYSVWWDTSLIAGDSFSNEIEAKLNTASCVIVVWSKNSIQSRWVIAEASMAMERNVLLPVYFGTIKIPLPFNQFHTSDISHFLKNNRNIPDDLLKALGKFKKPSSLKNKVLKNEGFFKKLKYKSYVLPVTILTISMVLLVVFLYVYDLKSKNRSLENLETRVSDLQKLTKSTIVGNIKYDNSTDINSNNLHENNISTEPSIFIKEFYKNAQSTDSDITYDYFSKNVKKSFEYEHFKTFWKEDVRYVEVLRVNRIYDLKFNVSLFIDRSDGYQCSSDVIELQSIDGTFKISGLSFVIKNCKEVLSSAQYNRLIKTKGLE